MAEIPEDIMQTARMCTTDGEIASALLAERQSATATERERCAKTIIDMADIASKIVAQGWRGNPNMSGDDRDFMGPMQRRRHDDRILEAMSYIAAAIRGRSHD